MNTKRPIGLTILAVFLWWLALAGVAGAFVYSSGSLGLTGAFVAYAVAATIAGIALWRRKRWAAAAFAVWSCIALANGLLFDLMFNLGPTLRGAGALVVAACLFWLLYRYVRAHSVVGV